MNNKYEYVQVDPKVIAMLGGSDDMAESMQAEFGDDLPPSAVDSYNVTPKTKSMFEDVNNNPMMLTPSQDSVPGLLQEILNELREIKVILAGR